MKHLTKNISTVALALGFITAAFAQTPPAPNPITPPMHQDRLQERLKAADTDKDGLLSKAEVQAAGIRPLIERFDEIDTNKDGKLSPDEIKAGRPKHPDGKHMDKDKPHGFKSPQERRAMMEAHFKKADTNGDGGLNKDELKAAGMTRHLDRFDTFDTNKDGKITLEEMHVAIEKHMSKDRRPPQQ